MKMIKNCLLLMVIVILGGISCSNSRVSRVVKVVKGPFYIKVHSVGQLKSAASTYIGCPPVRRMWNYTISFMAPEGKKVKPGTMILGFDTKELQEKMVLKSSELETAKKELEKIRLVEQEQKENFLLELEEARVKKETAIQMAVRPSQYVALIDVKKARMELELATLKEVLSQSRVENQIIGMKTRIQTQESKVKRLQKEVSEVAASIARLSVKAPKEGIIVYISNWRGEKKAVRDRCWVGENIMEMPELDRMQVKAVIPEPEAGKVTVSQPVEIRLDSNPDRVFKGKVKELGRIFRTKSHDQPSIVFDAVISIDDPDPELMLPGMAAGVDIIVSSKENVLQVPEAAIIYLEDGLFVWKKGFLGKKMVAVTTGPRSGGMVEILEGLIENDRIVILTAGE
ncbi:MAG: HlyD family efflux transporter periplasmic adaptor subunit [Candidatus Aminicenantes bacterium]|nr:HlyD family efflux transporter periplasmic adaptor subunit [Candidatus Aminicenantes bacterium]